MPCRSAPLGLLLAACASPPARVVEPPKVVSSVRHYAGNVLTGRRPSVEAAERVRGDDAFAVRCRVRYVRQPPEAGLEPLADRSRLVITALGDEPLLPTTTLSIDARVGAGAAAREYLRTIASADRDAVSAMLDLRGVLPAGVTAAFGAESVDAVFNREIGEVRRRLAILVSRAQRDDLTVALLVENLDPDSPMGAGRAVLERQVILLEDAPKLAGAPLVLVVPSLFEVFGRYGFLIELSVGRPVDDAANRAALEGCVADLRLEAKDALAGDARFDASEALIRAVAANLRALDLARNHREALVFFAGSNDAPLALDLALSASPTILAGWVQSVPAVTGGAMPGSDAEAHDLAWTLERTAWRLLADRLDRDDLSTELRGMLERHGGEAGRLPGAIVACLERSRDREGFQRMLVDENRSFLASADPAARVRAFDWLRARELAPAGFDPLAPREQRRDALERDDRERAEER